MFTFEFGLYPLTAIVVGALLTLIYFGVIRLKSSPRWAIGFIIAAMLTITVSGVLSIVRWVELESTVEVEAEPKATTLSTVEVVGYHSGTQPMPRMDTPTPTTTHEQVWHLFSDISQLFGWLWLSGVAVLLLSMVWQCVQLWQLKRRQQRVDEVDGVALYDTEGIDAYSFGHNVFIPRMFDDELRRFMLLHEMAHVRHRHFLWLCLLQVLLAINWYNPFCWVLFREMRLQQELQVDGDVLRQGVDRMAYQYSLLRASMQGGRPVWILSAFGHKPLTNRVAFMNRVISSADTLRRALLSTVLALAVLSLAVVVACQNNEKLREHPLMGWWKMDFTKDTGSDTEMYPFGKQIAFYNYDTFLTITYRTRNGKSLCFTFSAEETRLKGDTLVDALGEPMRYRFINENTFQNEWYKQPYQSAMPQGPEITDQWSRIAVDEELLELFQMLYHADEAHSGKFDGVWERENPEKAHKYLVVNADWALVLYFHRQEPKAYRAAGHGYCGRLQDFGEFLQIGYEKPVQYTMPDADRFIVKDNGEEKVYRRIPMPADLKRMFSAPMTHEHCDQHSSDAGQPEEQSEEPVFGIAEHMPEFPEGQAEMYKWISHVIKYPKECAEEGKSGTVRLQFIVEKDGSISQPRILSSSDPCFEAEALRVVSLMPRWKPGRQQGRRVRCRITLPITFRLN